MKEYAAYDGLLANIKIDDIISRYISIKKTGQNYAALCPFHQDKNPSLMINPTKQIFKCFVCNVGGNAIRFVQLYEKITYPEAAQKIANMVGYKNDFFTKSRIVSKEESALAPLHKAIDDLTGYYQYNLLTKDGIEAKEYLVKRGLDESYFQRFKIGFSPVNGKETIAFMQNKGHSLKTLQDIGILSGNLEDPYDRNQGRVMFTLFNPSGQSVGYSARALKTSKDVPKYINSPETKLFVKSRNLYNYHNAKNILNVSYVYLVEGFMDALALDRAGIKSVVALMGTAFTSEQITLLRQLNKEVRILLDSDLPGQGATVGVIKDLMKANITFKVVAANEEELDPDEYLKKHGQAKFEEMVNTFATYAEYVFNYYAAHFKENDTEGNRKFVTDIMNEVILDINNRLEVSSFIDKLSTKSGFNSLVLNEMYTQAKKRKDSKEHALNVVGSRLPLKQTLNKVTQAERYILMQMLYYPLARRFFEDEVKVFSNEIYRYLANYLKEYCADESVNYASVLNDINIRFKDEEKTSLYTTEILALEEEGKDTKYDPLILEDALATLKYEKTLKLLTKEHEEALLKAKDEEAYTLEKARYLAAKLKLSHKYKRK